MLFGGSTLKIYQIASIPGDGIGRETVSAGRRVLDTLCEVHGGLRLEYPPEIKIVQLPCTGKLDVLLALQAFEDGVDGIMAAG